MREWIKEQIEKGNRNVIKRVDRKGGLDNLSDADVKVICRACGYKEKSADEIAYLEWKQAYETYKARCNLLSSIDKFNGDFFGAVSNPTEDCDKTELESLAEKVKELTPAAKSWAKFLGRVVYEDYLRKCKEV